MALTQRFKQVARATEQSVQAVTRQFAYDRLLARVFSSPDSDNWVLKGGGAMLARLDGARHSMDIDLFRPGLDLTKASCDLRHAASSDLGDHIRFAIDDGTPLAVAEGGVRHKIQSSLGRKPFQNFWVDLVVGTRMSGRPDLANPILDLDIPGLISPSYRVFPLADHIADKVCAIHEVRTGPNGEAHGSTRVKDLVDLVCMALTQEVDADATQSAISQQTSGRDRVMPRQLTIPDPERWAQGYENMARQTSILFSHLSYSAGLALVQTLIDPLLSGEATGTWCPRQRTWRS